MLRPAQLYKDKLAEENIKSWYDSRNIYWNGGVGDSVIDLPDHTYDRHDFVSVDKQNNVLGYIGYNVDWVAMSASRFSIISFQKGNMIFVKDLYQAICDLFYTYHMNRISWLAYADNPAVKGYRNFIKRHGGRECGYQRQVVKLLDGTLHDIVYFEILAEEFKNSKSRIKGKEERSDA